jgi:hypothetical protein
MNIGWIVGNLAAVANFHMAGVLFFSKKKTVFFQIGFNAPILRDALKDALGDIWKDTVG